MKFEFFVPTRILFGEGTVDELSSRPMPGRRALLVISGGRSAKASGAFDKVYAALNAAGSPPVVYDKVGANPTLACVNEGARKPIGGWFFPTGKYVYCALAIVALVAGALLGGIG